MIRAHKIRLNPTPEQAVYFRKAAGTKRFVYNWALDHWKWAKGLGEFIRQIEYKSVVFGGQVVKVGRFYASSKTCNDCGHINKELTLSDRTWVCQGCGTSHQRDWNAAKNIEQEAHRIACA